VGITQKVVSIENFLSVSVTGKTAHFQAIAIDGRTLDEFDYRVADTFDYELYEMMTRQR